MNDLEIENKSWGLGAATNSSLLDRQSVERAFYKTKTVYMHE